jgi:hypothetical protein
MAISLAGSAVGGEAHRLAPAHEATCSARVLASATAPLTDREALCPVLVPSIGSSIPTLTGAAALGTLVSVDSKHTFAEFRISCGWYYTPRRKVRPGLWKVGLRNLKLGLVDPVGAERTFPFAVWWRVSEQNGWSGTLKLSDGTSFISDGPTTDICAGILG